MGLREPQVRAGVALTPLGWDAVGGQGSWRVLSSGMGHPWALFWGESNAGLISAPQSPLSCSQMSLSPSSRG